MGVCVCVCVCIQLLIHLSVTLFVIFIDIHRAAGLLYFLCPRDGCQPHFGRVCRHPVLSRDQLALRHFLTNPTSDLKASPRAHDLGGGWGVCGCVWAAIGRVGLNVLSLSLTDNTVQSWKSGKRRAENDELLGGQFFRLVCQDVACPKSS